MIDQFKSSSGKVACKGTYYQACFNSQCKSTPFMCDIRTCYCNQLHQKCQCIKWQTLLQTFERKNYHNNTQFRMLNTTMQEIYKLMMDDLQTMFQQYKRWAQSLGLNEDEKTFKKLVRQNKQNQITNKLIKSIVKSMKEPMKEYLFQKKQQLIFESKKFKNQVDNLKKRYEQIYKYIEVQQSIDKAQSKIVLKSIRGTVSVLKKKPKNDNQIRKLFQTQKKKISNNQLYDQFYFKNFKINQYIKENKETLKHIFDPINFKTAQQMVFQFGKIQRLDFSDTTLDATQAKIISKCKNVNSLNLCDNNILEIGGLEIAQNLINLTYLNLCNNQIGNKATIAICQNLKKLTFLDLQNNNITNESAKSIALNLINLSQLVLNQNQINGIGAVQLPRRLKKLKWLQLENNPIQQEQKTQIKNLMKDKNVYL